MECLAKTTIDYLIDTEKPQLPQPPPTIQRSLSNLDAFGGCGSGGIGSAGPPKSIESASEMPLSTQNPNSVDSGLGSGAGDQSVNAAGTTTSSQPAGGTSNTVAGSVSSTNIAPLISPLNNSADAPLLPPTSVAGENSGANADGLDDMAPNSVAAGATSGHIDDHQAFSKINNFYLKNF